MVEFKGGPFIITFELRKIRLEKKITQKKLANKLGVTQPYISELEYGLRYPKLDLVGKIAKILEVCPKELINFHCYDNNNDVCFTCTIKNTK